MRLKTERAIKTDLGLKGEFSARQREYKECFLNKPTKPKEIKRKIPIGILSWMEK